MADDIKVAKTAVASKSPNWDKYLKVSWGENAPNELPFWSEDQFVGALRTACQKHNSPEPIEIYIVGPRSKVPGDDQLLKVHISSSRIAMTGAIFESKATGVVLASVLRKFFVPRLVGDEGSEHTSSFADSARLSDVSNDADPVGFVLKNYHNFIVIRASRDDLYKLGDLGPATHLGRRVTQMSAGISGEAFDDIAPRVSVIEYARKSGTDDLKPRGYSPAALQLPSPLREPPQEKDTGATLAKNAPR
ncbi:hypothetical protein HY988_06805 [Candidatus Micrarchaeota archaeon]|nr:hypothetical protein [Candidatus Micrarchaeota archaeon]